MPFLHVDNLTVRYPSRRGHAAVDHVSFSVDAGEIVGVSGPSGCGKTTIAMAIAGLLPSEAEIGGNIHFRGRKLNQLHARDLEAIRGAQIGVIFQEPALALNPMLTVGAQIAEVVRAHERCDRASARARALQAMEDVGLSEERARIFDAYPHELSGGQRQRILIAQAIVCRPSLVVADEPTASLDATVRADLLRLIRALSERHGTAFLLISHSVDVLATTARRVIVMEAGRITGKGVAIGQRPGIRHPHWVQATRWSAARRQGATPLVEVIGATKSFRPRRRLLSRRGPSVQALAGASLRIESGTALGLAGNSGCGKSTLARCLAGLDTLDSGAIRIDGHDIAPLRGRELLPFRNQVQLIFQDSAAALNPRFTALEIVSEPMRIQHVATPAEQRLRAIELMMQVGLPAERVNDRPGEFSGGERQRLAIARALAVNPRLLILDESFSGLDVGTRNHITELLMDLQASRDLTFLCISHDLGLLGEFASSVVVMHQGNIVERPSGSKTPQAPPDPIEAVA